MTRRAAAVLLLALLAAVGALVFVTRPRAAAERGRRVRAFLRVTPVPSAAAPAGGTPAVTPAPTVRITVFFPGEEDGKLRPEERDIARPSSPEAYLKAIFAEVQRGPTRPGLTAALPVKLQLRNAFLLPDGVAVLDLAVDAGLSFGSSEELAIVAALVDTVLQNVADTTRVRILVNGEPAETLGGHVDLTHALPYLRNEVAP